MKKNILCLLLFVTGFSLPAATPEAFIFFQPISGTGSNQDDRVDFTQMLINEIYARNCILLDSPYGADYILYGSIVPYYAEYQDLYHSNISKVISNHAYNAPPEDTTEQWYVFQLTLRNSHTHETVIQQNLFYPSIEEAYSFFPLMVQNLFAQIIDTPETIADKDILDDDKWLDNWLYFGMGFFWAPRIYYYTTQSALYSNFGVGVSAEIRFLKFMSLEAGAEIVPDWVMYTSGEDRDLMLEIPLSLKFIFRLSNHHMLSPYGGMHLNISLYQNTVPSMFSWLAGIMYGVKVGSGTLFINPRFSMDLSPSFVYQEENIIQYRRYLINVGIGYKFGVVAK